MFSIMKTAIILICVMGVQSISEVQGTSADCTDDQGCDRYIAEDPARCYLDHIRSKCCTNCSAVETGIDGCIYGDKLRHCGALIEASQDSCSWAGGDCCWSCRNYVETDSSSTETGFDISTATNCTDRWGCLQYITREPARCYLDNIRSMCCTNCSAVDTGIEGCRYGDRMKICPRLVYLNASSCSWAGDDCCWSCRNYTSEETDPGSATSDSDSTPLPCTTEIAGCGVNIEEDPSLCYLESVRDNCCYSCGEIETGIDNCTYGDKERFCSSLVSTDTSLCSSLQDRCCRSCRNYTSITIEPSDLGSDSRPAAADSMCNDPCSPEAHRTLDDAIGYRSVAFYSSMGPFLSDHQLDAGWYRFKLEGANAVMSTTPMTRFSCASYNPMSLKIFTVLPRVGREKWTTACAGDQADGSRCWNPSLVGIRNCTSFIVYKLVATQHDFRYCVESA